MKEKVFKACLKAIESYGFKSFTFTKAAEDSGVPIETFHKHFSSPLDVMIHLFQKIDEMVLKQFEKTPDISTKDELFDILMLRFELSQPYKPVLKSFWQDCLFLPNEYPPLLCQALGSMGWMLDAVGTNARGLTGLLKTQGLLGIYLFTLKTWLTDDTAELGKTMAALDKSLSNMESAAKMIDSLTEFTLPFGTK